jgi:predicted ATPase
VKLCEELPAARDAQSAAIVRTLVGDQGLEQATGEQVSIAFKASSGSRRQGARAWELRAAVDLAALLDARAPERARALLQPVFEPYAEGSDTSDLTAAERLLATLG